MSPRPTLRALALATGLAALALSGCSVHAHVRAPAPPEVVVFGPAVHVGPVRHFHNQQCGHSSRWHGGRWVFYVADHWEYVEGGNLYVYRTIRSAATTRVVVHKTKRPKPDRARGRGRGNDRDRDDDDDDDGSRGSVRESDRDVPRYAPSPR